MGSELTQLTPEITRSPLTESPLGRSVDKRTQKPGNPAPETPRGLPWEVSYSVGVGIFFGWPRTLQACEVTLPRDAGEPGGRLPTRIDALVFNRGRPRGGKRARPRVNEGRVGPPARVPQPGQAAGAVRRPGHPTTAADPASPASELASAGAHPQTVAPVPQIGRTRNPSIGRARE